MDYMLQNDQIYYNYVSHKLEQLHLYWFSKYNEELSLCFKNLADSVSEYLNIIDPPNQETLLFIRMWL